MKMAAAYADMLGAGLGLVAKKRTSATTVEAINVVGEVNGCDVLLVDDITETAGTLTAAAKMLRESGARTRPGRGQPLHPQRGGLRAAQDRRDRRAHHHQLHSRSIPAGCPSRSLSIAGLLGEAIQRINSNESITSLFKIKGF